MLTLALDVDGVLLDSERGGQGHWSNELRLRFGIEPTQIREAFFVPSWDDVVLGRRRIEEALGQALVEIGTEADFESVLSCWFESDYVPFEKTFDLARSAARAGHRVVLATNQEHRRADYLRERIGAVVPLEDIFYSADVGHQKYDPRFFEVASRRLGLDKSELSSVVFVDDTMSNVETARSFGWQAVHAHSDGIWRNQITQMLELDS